MRLILLIVFIIACFLILDALINGGTSVILDITESIYYIIYIITFPLSFLVAGSIKDWLKKKVGNKYLRCVVDIAFFIASIYILSAFVSCDKKINKDFRELHDTIEHND